MMAVSLNDFQMIIKIEFMYATKMVSMSFLNSLRLMGGDVPYVVSVFQGGTKDPQ